MSMEIVKNELKNVPEEYHAGLRYGLPLAWIGRNEDKAYLTEEMERTFADLLEKGFNVIETGGQGSGSDPENDGFPGENWKRMFKKLLRRCNELGIHVQLTAIMNGQPMGYLEDGSDKCENYRPKRLYATEPAENLSGTVTELTLEGESITPANTPVAVVAVRHDDKKQWHEAKLLPIEDFAISIEEIPEGERTPANLNSARIKIELKGNEALKELDTSCVMRGIRGPVTDDGQPNPAPMSMPGGPPPAPAEGEEMPGGPGGPEGTPGGPEGTPGGPEGAPGGMPAGGPPGYEERAIVIPATHKVTFTYTGSGIELGVGDWDIIAYYQLPIPMKVMFLAADLWECTQATAARASPTVSLPQERKKSSRPMKSICLMTRCASF